MRLRTPSRFRRPPSPPPRIIGEATAPQSAGTEDTLLLKRPRGRAGVQGPIRVSFHCLEAGPFKYNLLDVIPTNDRNKERMTSDRKAEANRRNALKSTGLKTPEGKAAVRHNALKHGLLSREVLLPGEDKEALQELGERLRAELQPVGELEDLLVDRIIAAYWRLRRLGRVEAGIFAWSCTRSWPSGRRGRRAITSHHRSMSC